MAFPGSESLIARHCVRGVRAGPPARALHAAAVKGRARGNRRARGRWGGGRGASGSCGACAAHCARLLKHGGGGVKTAIGSQDLSDQFD